MKKIYLLTIVLLASLQLFAQKFEYSIQVNTGLLNYTGDGAITNSAVYEGYPGYKNYVGDPFSKQSSASYGFSFQDQFVTKNGFIVGLQAGYEILRSKVNINQFYPAEYAYPFESFNSLNGNYVFGPFTATGNSVLQSTYIDINPYVGYRFGFGRYKLDILPGVDIGLGLHSHESGKATSNNSVYSVDTTLSKPLVDVRARLGVAATYKHYSLTASYAHGITNDDRNQTNNNASKVYSELFRVGLGYRF